MQAGRFWNDKFCGGMTAVGPDKSKEDPRVFHKVVDGEADMLAVVHVDGILVYAKKQATTDGLVAELEQKFI